MGGARKRLESAMRERLGRLEQPQGSALSTTHFLDESLHALEQHLPASVAADEARARLLDEVRGRRGSSCRSWPRRIARSRRRGGETARIDL